MSIVFTSGELYARNGGTKTYNLCVQLLRENGYDAYIATQDGMYESWLVNHQPVVSYAQVREMETPKIVTSWLMTPELETFGGPIYYFDADLKWTLRFRSMLDHLLKAGHIAGIATHSRYIQAWYMATYGITPTLIREWSDTSVFYPDEQARAQGRIGCMVDDPGSERTYQALDVAYPRQILPISGDEQQVADQMRTVDIFAGLNPGKHPLWGEGSPRTQQEAMHCGCVLVAFDVFGNREYLYNGWTGRLVERGDQEGLVETITYLLDHPEEKEQLRQHSIDIARALLSATGKIGLLERWLDL